MVKLMLMHLAFNSNFGFAISTVFADV